MLQAMNTGHEGSLSTAHANSTRHLLWRLETMAMMSDVELPAAHIRNQVASAVDVIVHLAAPPRRPPRRVGDRRGRGDASRRARRDAAVPIPGAGRRGGGSRRPAPSPRSPATSRTGARTSSQALFERGSRSMIAAPVGCSWRRGSSARRAVRVRSAVGRRSSRSRPTRPRGVTLGARRCPGSTGRGGRSWARPCGWLVGGARGAAASSARSSSRSDAARPPAAVTPRIGRASTSSSPTPSGRSRRACARGCRCRRRSRSPPRKASRRSRRRLARLVDERRASVAARRGARRMGAEVGHRRRPAGRGRVDAPSPERRRSPARVGSGRRHAARAERGGPRGPSAHRASSPVGCDPRVAADRVLRVPLD